MEIKPIETVYNGYRFRSRLEARWAVFFDSLRVEYLYEPEGFQTEYGRYLPDFFLPKIAVRTVSNKKFGTFFEVKQPNYRPNKKADSIIRELVKFKKSALILACGYPEILTLKNKTSGEAFQYLYDPLNESLVFWDNFMLFCKCHRCGKMKFEFAESSYLYCNCGGVCDPNHHEIEIAIIKSRKARFEFGETP
jgi:hypothetical protein